MDCPSYKVFNLNSISCTYIHAMHTLPCSPHWKAHSELHTHHYNVGRSLLLLLTCFTLHWKSPSRNSKIINFLLVQCNKVYRNVVDRSTSFSNAGIDLNLNTSHLCGFDSLELLLSMCERSRTSD